jgi:hypothetical protein
MYAESQLMSEQCIWNLFYFVFEDIAIFLSAEYAAFFLVGSWQPQVAVCAVHVVTVFLL